MFSFLLLFCVVIDVWYSPNLRRQIERAGFIFRPMMIKRDRCVCDACGVEVSGWRPWVCLSLFLFVCLFLIVDHSTIRGSCMTGRNEYVVLLLLLFYFFVLIWCVCVFFFCCIASIRTTARNAGHRITIIPTHHASDQSHNSLVGFLSIPTETTVLTPNDEIGAICFLFSVLLRLCRACIRRPVNYRV